MPDDNTQEIPPGTILGDYAIERTLGQGGFGITYLATDVAQGTRVVIKENLPSAFAFRDASTLEVHSRRLSGDAGSFEWAVQNFLNEARTLARLDHPGIVKVTRAFSALGTAYFVMPYIEGESLDKFQSNHTAPSEAWLRYLLDTLLEALSYLHGNSLLHRDIKPANILLTAQGRPLLIDFGTARQIISEKSQTVIESPGYTPFEQMQSHGHGNVGAWSDLYALGGTLYKLITGETPPKCTNRISRHDPLVPLSSQPQLRSMYSESLLAGIDKALAIWPEGRWQSAEEWRMSLRSSTVPPKRQQRPARQEPPKPTPSPSTDTDLLIWPQASRLAAWPLMLFVLFQANAYLANSFTMEDVHQFSALTLSAVLIWGIHALIARRMRQRNLLRQTVSPPPGKNRGLALFLAWGLLPLATWLFGTFAFTIACTIEYAHPDLGGYLLKVCHIYTQAFPSNMSLLFLFAFGSWVFYTNLPPSAPVQVKEGETSPHQENPLIWQQASWVVFGLFMLLLVVQHSLFCTEHWHTLDVQQFSLLLASAAIVAGGYTHIAAQIAPREKERPTPYPSCTKAWSLALVLSCAVAPLAALLLWWLSFCVFLVDSDGDVNFCHFYTGHYTEHLAIIIPALLLTLFTGWVCNRNIPKAQNRSPY